MIGSHGENLIFLVSQPRSGSTLLQYVLAGIRDIHTTSEPWIALPPVLAARTPGLNRDAITDFCATLSGGEASYWHACAGFLRELYNSALYQSDRGDGHPRRMFLDKTPRYYAILPELKRMFPGARFIVLLRNPLAVFASVLKTWTQDPRDTLMDFREDLVLAPPQLLHGIQMLPNLTVVRYEKFVTEPGTELERICQGLEISPDPKALNYGNLRPLSGRMGDPLIHDFSRPTVGSLTKWKSTLIGKVNLANEYLGQLEPSVLAELGYPLETLREELASIKTV